MEVSATSIANKLLYSPFILKNANVFDTVIVTSNFSVIDLKIRPPSRDQHSKNMKLELGI